VARGYRSQLEDGTRTRLQAAGDRSRRGRAIREPWFVHHAAQHYGLTVQEPPLDLAPRLPETYRQRAVQALTLTEARGVSRRAFIKPTDQKVFSATVYDSGAALPN